MCWVRLSVIVGTQKNRRNSRETGGAGVELRGGQRLGGGGEKHTVPLAEAGAAGLADMGRPGVGAGRSVDADGGADSRSFQELPDSSGQVSDVGVGGVNQGSASLAFLLLNQVNQGLFLGVDGPGVPGRQVDDDLALARFVGCRGADGFSLGAAAGVGQEGLEVGCQQSGGALWQGFQQGPFQFGVKRLAGGFPGEIWPLGRS